MKVGTIVENRVAGYKTYFVFMNVAGRMAHGIEVTIVEDKPRISRATYYKSSLRVDEDFPVVGYVDVKNILINAILQAVQENER